MKQKVGVLASGRGSNFEALLHHERTGFFQNIEIACLIVDQPQAGALEIAQRYGVPAYTLLRKDFSSKEAFEQAIAHTLDLHGVSWVVLAGYMRLVGPTLLDKYPQRILNIHPALLPSFPGLHAQRQALEYGVKVSGCTVHFVDSGMDTGPIIVQRCVPVLPNDTEETLSARILEQEHQAYAHALKAVTERPWRIEGRVVRFLDETKE
ncbi:MAG: phosphoribosylglycinamide formyltransferase [Candidatus Sumerlaeaceae bacterium]|nr:phosphoribosylglycinamide formyltransferase [Candidatus Sumerlaeaceae bacterium]